MQIKVEHTLANICEKLKKLLDVCFPLPPRNVFFLTIRYYKVGDPIYYYTCNKGEIIAFVYCSRNSKGGTLENIAVHPDYRYKGVASKLINSLLKDNKGIITLTTRIPDFFRKRQFIDVAVLPDQSTFMYKVNFQLK